MAMAAPIFFRLFSSMRGHYLVIVVVVVFLLFCLICALALRRLLSNYRIKFVTLIASYFYYSCYFVDPGYVVIDVMLNGLLKNRKNKILSLKLTMASMDFTKVLLYHYNYNCHKATVSSF